MNIQFMIPTNYILWGLAIFTALVVLVMYFCLNHFWEWKSNRVIDRIFADAQNRFICEKGLFEEFGDWFDGVTEEQQAEVSKAICPYCGENFSKHDMIDPAVCPGCQTILKPEGMEPNAKAGTRRK